MLVHLADDDDVLAFDQRQLHRGLSHKIEFDPTFALGRLLGRHSHSVVGDDLMRNSFEIIKTLFSFLFERKTNLDVVDGKDADHGVVLAFVPIFINLPPDEDDVALAEIQFPDKYYP